MSDALAPACERTDLVHAEAVQALPPDESATLAVHLAQCSECRALLDALTGLVGRFDQWPIDVLRPPPGLRDQLARRIGADPGSRPVDAYAEPPWREVAPGISCKLLSTDRARGLVSMLVRLAPGVDYPPHRHADLEELHLLDGELWIEERKLVPGDYNRAEAGTCDQRVHSASGCTCFLVTSAMDELR